MMYLDSLEARQLFAGGAFDSTFAGGSVTANVLFKLTHGQTTSLSKVVSDSGGRTYVLATTGRANADASTLQIRRLTAAGTLDGGWVKAKSNNAIFPLGSTPEKYKSIPQIDALVDSSDRLVLLLGTKVYRFTVAGTLDRTFGKKGVTTLPGMTAGAAMAADSTGRIYVVGSAATTAQFGQAVLDRLTASGRIDTTFQKTGSYAIPKYAPRTSTNVSSNGVAVRVLAGDSVVVMAAASYNIYTDNGGTYPGTIAEKFTAAGAVDKTYGTSGIAVDFGHQYPASYNFDSATPAGIRSDGAVVIYRHGGDEQTSFARNEVIAADGKSVKGNVHFSPGDAYLIHRDDINGRAVQFIAQSDGSELVVQPGAGLFHVLKTGAYDTTFNSGAPVLGVQSAALQLDKTVVVAQLRTSGGDVAVERVFRDNNPVATLIAKPLTTAAATYTFNIQYRGAARSIDASSLGSSGVRVVASNGRTRYATLIGTTTLADHSVIGKYQIADFTGGAWDASNNGTYSVVVLDNAVLDEDGKAVQRRTLGNLTVAIA